MRRSLITGAAVALLATAGLAGPAQAAPADHVKTATVGVFHAVPGTPVDVYLGKTKIVDDFQPGTFAGPLQVPAGSYTVRITKADATSYKHPIIGPATVRFAGGKNYSVIAHLTSKGKPTVTKYVNDLSAVGDGKARLTVRHVGYAPAVDVKLNGAVAVAGLKNPKQAKAVVKAGTYTAGAYLAGTHSIVIGPVTYDVEAGTNTIIYAWGDGTKKGNLAFTVRALPLK